jgi:hypothetical protein
MTTAIVGPRGAAPALPSLATSQAMGAGPSGLLPAAEAPALGQLQGAMAELYMIMSQLRDAQTEHSKTRTESTKMGRDIAEREQAEALARAKEAAESGGFFDWISKDIGLAGVVGLVTFNYALVAADVAAHKLDLVENVKVDVVDLGAVATGRYDVLAADLLLRKTDLAPREARAILEKLGIPKDAPGLSDEDVKPVARKALMLNLLVLSVGATIFSAGSTTGLCIAAAGLAFSAAGSQVAENEVLDGVLGKGASRWVGLGMQIYGAAATGMSGLANGAALGAAAKVGGTVAHGAATTARATDKIVRVVHDKQAADARVVAEAAKLQLNRLERLIDFLIDGMKEAASSSRKAGEAIQQAITAADQTQLVISNGTRV